MKKALLLFAIAGLVVACKSSDKSSVSDPSEAQVPACCAEGVCDDCASAMDMKCCDDGTCVACVAKKAGK